MSMIVRGTEPGKKASGSLVGGNTLRTFVGKLLPNAVPMRLDFPVPLSPATTILIPGFVSPAEAFTIEDAAKQSKTPKTVIKKHGANAMAERKYIGLQGRKPESVKKLCIRI